MRFETRQKRPHPDFIFFHEVKGQIKASIVDPHGHHLEDAVTKLRALAEFAEKYGISMPIAREVDGVVNHGSSVEQAYRGLAAEKPGHEVHGAGF